MEAACSMGCWEEGVSQLGFPMVMFLWPDEKSPAEDKMNCRQTWPW